MDTYKLKFTRLQNGIFRLLCVKAGKAINQREIANLLKVSPTAVSKSLINLEKEKLILIKKDFKMNLNLVELNRENSLAIGLKRIENLKIIYESDMINFLEEKFPGAIIILFGSYSYGEDYFNSDIDIAVVGSKQKEIDLGRFEKILKREVNVNVYQSFRDIHKNLKSNIFNGIVLSGRIAL